MDWNIGCSGFYYRHWKGSFYPEDIPMRKWFEYYCEHFKTVELNTTFYHFPKPGVLDSWYKRSPEDFKFTVKAPQLISHYKKFVGCRQLAKDFYSSAQKGLKEKLGCVLFQLHPRTVFSEAKLSDIIQTIDSSYTNVVEFRHASWWKAEVIKELSKHNITFAGISYPHLPVDVIMNTSVLYYRLHGVPNLYTSGYSEDELEKIVKRIKSFKKLKQAWLYFNNDSKGWAYNNAASMIGKIT